MESMLVGIPDKLLVPYLKGKQYIPTSDEAEACAIAGGMYLATGKRATVFMSADGFCNCLNFLTSWIMPEKIKMNFVISVGRQEYQHKVMSDILEDLILLLNVNTKNLSFRLIGEE